MSFSAICFGTRGKIILQQWTLLADTQSVSEHAGVTPDPITGSSRSPSGALDVVLEVDEPPGYDDPQIPRITIDSA